MDALFKNIVFLFGAGATAGTGCLTSGQMLNELRKAVNKVSLEEKAKAYMEIYEFLYATLQYQNSIKSSSHQGISYVPNIEDFVFLLRKIINRKYIIPAPLVGTWREDIVKLEIHHKDIFVDFLALIENQLHDEWLNHHEEEEIRKLLSPIQELLPSLNDTRIEIFTLNYDLVLEQFFNQDGITNLNNGFVQGRWINNFADKEIEAKINYYKIHGSLDWEQDASGEISCSVSHEGSTDPLIIFGQENKMLSIDPFLSLVFDFKRKLEEADFYIIIGYSFFDTYINNLILQGVNQDPDKKIIIVDIQKQEAEKFVNKIRSIQDNEFTQDFYNLKTVDASKVYIISETSASDFFQEYLGNEAAKLKELIENLTKEEEETPF